MIWLVVLTGLVLTGCYTHVVDTWPKWCEQITGIDLQRKYRPFWAQIFAVRFDGDRIRDDFVRNMNEMHVRAVQNDELLTAAHS